MTASLASMTGFARSGGQCRGPRLGLGTAQRQRPRPRSALPPAARLGRAGAGAARGRRQALKRGNVTANLTVKRESEPRLVADPAALEQVLALAMELHSRIPGSPPPRAEALLACPACCAPAQTDDSRGSDTAAAGVQAGFVDAPWPHWSRRARPRARGSRAMLPGLLDEIAALHRQAAARRPTSPRRSAPG